MKHDIESCDLGGENQDMTWLDGPAAIMSAPHDKRTGTLFGKC
jgi:hypothetical protein